MNKIVKTHSVTTALSKDSNSFVPKAALAKHGAAYLMHGVNMFDTSGMLGALRKARLVIEGLLSELVTASKKPGAHLGVSAMHSLCVKARNALDGLLVRVDTKQKGVLYPTQLGAAQGALTQAGMTVAAAAAVLDTQAPTSGHPALTAGK